MIEATQKFCKHCEKWLDVSQFQSRRLRCMDCYNAHRRTARKANARRREYYRNYQRQLGLAKKHLPSFIAVAQALINGETERAERLAKHAYAKALKEGIA